MAITTAEIGYIVHSLIIPLQAESLVLPCAAVAEIVPYTELQKVEQGPEWLLGTLSWRGKTISVVSFESISGHRLSSDLPSHIAVINGQEGYGDLPFYGISIVGIPRLVRVDEKNIVAQERKPGDGALVLSRALVKGEPAIIPDCGVIEKLLQRSVIH